MAPWPNNAKAALSFTMDNLGEAQDVLTHTWPASQPYGTHPAVHQTLPRILALLAQHNVRATYFAESWSLQHYPAAIASLQSAGHEVAWHGYQHEVWHRLSEAEERANFERSWAEAGKHGDGGVRYKGFRPPGGKVNGERTMGLLREFGCAYVSPLGEFGIDEGSGVVVLPFEWEAVDAFWYMDNPKFVEIRGEHGFEEPEKAFGPRDFREDLMKRIEKVKSEGGYISVLFHPFLTDREERFEVLREVVERIAADGELWVAPCDEVSGWVKDHGSDFGFTSKG